MPGSRAISTSDAARPAVFLDRDGVLNHDDGYLHDFAKLRWIDGAIAAVAALNSAGYFVFVVTNQAGIARGYYTEDDVAALHRAISAALAEAGARIDDFRYCPDHPDGTVERYRRMSDWRKPGPGMLLDLMAHWPVAREGSVMIGDRPWDVEAGERAGVRGLLFPGGNLLDFVRHHGLVSAP